MTTHQSKLRLNAIKRILKDIEENKNHPIEGISVCIPNEDDVFTLHGNVIVSNGIYKDIILHVIIHMPNNYPHTGPAMNIAPGINFGHTFHEHIYDDPYNGNTICNDLLTNFEFFFSDKKEIATGWSPGYTLNTILMQMGLFFENPDLPEKLIPSADVIERFKLDLNNFICQSCGHRTLAPHPPINNNFDSKITIIESQADKDYDNLLQKVTCGISKLNIVADNNLILGCPLDVHLDRFKRIWAVPILETISYDAYIAEIQKAGIDKLNSYSSHYFTSAMGQRYNFWIPYYLSKDHFQRGFQTIINAISIIKHGSADGKSLYDFKPQDALDVLLSLCNKTVVNILDNKLHESKAAIEGYVHFLRLLIEFIDRYPVLKNIINTKIKNFTINRTDRNKLVVPDIGEFIITLFLSDYKYENVKQQLLEEYIARQIYWMEKKNVNMKERDIDIFLNNCFNASKVSCQLLVFNLEMAKTFIFDGVKEELDARFGFPPDKIVDSFQNTIKNIKNEINFYPEFLEAINFDSIISSKSHMVEYLEQSIQISKIQGYTGASSIRGSNSRYQSRTRKY